MKKRILFALLISAIIGTSYSTTTLATTNEPVVTYSNDNNIITVNYPAGSLIQSEIRNRLSGDIIYNYAGKQYKFNTYIDYVGYNRPNKFDAVLYAQMQFNTLLGVGLSLDGLFGQGTHSALERYQQSRGLPVDCVIGPTTWDYLTNYI